ncbi:alpha/beta fold hydrolase [Actinoalloteichus hymeniacidonis]|uniref:Alpha/beta hydrolase family protein n=1 Tax=Actinoalloteichus hymeniacidonis TaxID=340345 RepID=A0AAC9HUH7_9PSEU|nr:alpha/beta fold hydrolase [Actinoalloteichus hymeniacidonis]AOS65181.1 alpha/beta hydrolase family protein [Actinoalloteichus hymeniacidonis]MBB5906739.1 pimeloyl-ACP methyl ester carboxylesterase [Actinoalloteichus hymeniacidonis]
MRHLSRTPVFAISLLAISGLVAGCTTSVDGAPEPEIAVEQRGPAGVVPEGLSEFYGQAIEWGSCEDFALAPEESALLNQDGLECGRAEAPLDYADPEGDTISLGLVRRPADNETDRIGSLLVNPGGPGGSGVVAGAGLASAVAGTELGERFDLIGFDPRGVGTSEPAVRCLTDEEADEDRLITSVDTSPEGVAAAEERLELYVSRCVERSGTDLLAKVGTVDAVKDIDLLRSVLGDEKLSFLGFSYGTSLGSAYADAFPENVRALVLDGAVDPDQDAVDELVAQGAGFQQAFDAFAAWCAGMETCALGGDPAQAAQVFRGLVEPLIDNPLPTQDGRQLSYDDAETAVVQALYTQDLWDPLEMGLTELALGQGDMLILVADLYHGRDGAGKYSNMTDAFNAIRCVDETERMDVETAQEAERRYREAAPFLDDGREPGGIRDVCSFWPVEATAEPLEFDVDTLPETLVISTTGDPATPYQAGVDLAAALDASLLTFEGTQHGVFLQGVSCVDEIGIRYLIDLEVPAEDATC